MMRALWLLTGCLLSVPFVGTAQSSAAGLGFPASSDERAGTPPGYEKRLFQVLNGLPEGTVQAFAQTPDHYLWIGTTGGLVRFDGEQFKVFDRENTPAFHENSVFCMLTARDGSLWMGMEGSGLVHLVRGTMKAYTADDGLTDTFVRAIQQDQNGTIWIGTNNGLFQLKDPESVSNSGQKTIRRIDGSPELPSIAVNAIIEDSKGRLWLGGSQLVAMQNGKVKAYRLEGEPSRNRVKSITETSDGSIWVGTVAGLHRLRNGADKFEHIPNISGTVRVLRQTLDGTFWIGIVGRGGVAYHLDARGDLAAPSPLPTDAVLSIFEDTEHDVWIGTQSGLIRFSKTAATVIPLPAARDSDFGTVFLDRSGDLWAPSTKLFRIHDGVPHEVDLPGLKNVRVRNVFQDREGAFWLGTEGSGLFRMDERGLHHFDTKDGLVNNFVRVMMQTSDGSLWIGTDEGVSRLRDGHFTSFRMKEGLAYISIRSMIEDANHDVWIGTEQGLSHLHNDAFVDDVPVIALQRDKIWAIHQDSDGSLWFGTRNNGLFRYRNGRITHISSSEGLPTNSIYEILEDSSGHFWLSGAVGVWLLNRHQVDDLADGHPTHLTATFYSMANEMETVQLYGGIQNAGSISSSGDVWFPSNRGVVHIRLEAFKPPPATPLVIDGAVADGRAIPTARPIELTPGNHMLEIAYSAIMLRPQTDLRFRYRLDGVDKAWVDAGTRRVAYYTSLPPGTFDFRVQTFATNDPSEVSEAAIVIVQEPHFYRRWWFIACCLLLLAGVLFAIYRLRIRQMRRRFAAVLEERGRLAREMHDTLLQGCTSISAVLEAASNAEIEQDDGLKQHLLDCARTQICTTINEAREAVWSLRQPAGSNDLGKMLNNMAQGIAAESGIPVHTQTSSDAASLPQNIAREVVMVAREAVHNAILHAAPTKVTLNTARQSANIVVTIQDNGNGFDPTAALGNSGKHFGLVGMRERAEHVGGTLEVHSSRGAGTKVVLSVPMKVIASERQVP